uniref:Uncharacterized protein AlNc14C139G7184 n=1 Tax=Albugo laibachii Nc14 TaxID=890382 RepID=F0WKZ4_9STRA|nr:conserved hypothetical protein [Albugo laibachii Nc14]|eukprot:CCA21953.1 conserved hypothetical protein [Albugo laibachii Nc14]
MVLCVTTKALRYIWRKTLALWKCLTTLLSHRGSYQEGNSLISENDPMEEHKIDVACVNENDQDPTAIPTLKPLSRNSPDTFLCECHQPSSTQMREFERKWKLLRPFERKEAMNVAKVGISSGLSLISFCPECQMQVENMLKLNPYKKERKLNEYGINIINEDVLSLADVALVNPLETLSLFLHYESYGKNMHDHLHVANRLQVVPKKKMRNRCTMHSERPDPKRPIPAKFRVQWLHLTFQQQHQVTCIPASKLCTDLEAHIDRFKLSESSRQRIFAACKELVASRLTLSSTAFGTSILLLEPVSNQSRHVKLSLCFDTLLQLIIFATQNWKRKNITILTASQAQDEVLLCLGARFWMQMQAKWKSLESVFHERLTVYCIMISIRRNFEGFVERLHGHELMAQLLEEEDQDVQRLAHVRARRSDRKKRKRHSEKSKKQRKAAECNVAHEALVPQEELVARTHQEKRLESKTEQKKCKEKLDTVPETFLDSVDDAEELRLLCSMGWKAPVIKSRPLKQELDQHDAISEQELKVWRQNMGNLKSDRVAVRQLLQERFQRFMMRGAFRG